MTQERKHVTKGRQCACGIDCRRSCLFAQLLPSVVQNNRSMQISRPRRMQQVLEINLSRSGIEQVRATNDIRNALVPIIDNYSQLVGKKSIGALENKIPAVALNILYSQSLRSICERYRFGGYAKTPGSRRATGVNAPAASSRIPRLVCRPGDRVGRFATRAAAGIEEASIFQCIECGLVRAGPRALVKNRPVPLEAEFFETLQNCVRRSGLHAWKIEIFNANDPCAMMAARVKIARRRRDERSEVKWSCRRRRESPNVLLRRRKHQRLCPF